MTAGLLALVLALVVPDDKAAHALAGYGLSVTSGAVLGQWGGFVVGVSAGVAKEMHDARSDRDDLLATVGGAAVGGLMAGGW